MSKVFVNIALSLDGYMAPEGMTMENWDDARVQELGREVGCADALDHQPAVLPREPQARARRRDRSGKRHGPEHHGAHRRQHHGQANVRAGRASWPEEAPFHTPVYVLTHEKREPWVRPGGTTFYFVNDGPESALEQARESAGGRDIRIAGGADVIQQYLNMGVIDELEIALAPVLFGGGRRLFENLHESVPQFRIDKVLDGPAATHLRYVRG